MREELYRVSGIDFSKVPGFDVLTLQTIISEVGLNMDKWPTQKHFVSWLGLSPANKITGEKVMSSRTRKVNNRASCAFRLAAYAAARSESAIGGYCRRLKQRLGAPKAMTAAARKLACIFYSLLKYGQDYVEKGMDYYEKLYEERVIKNLSKKASELGFVLMKKEPLASEVS